jgi:hypothetical protein
LLPTGARIADFWFWFVSVAFPLAPGSVITGMGTYDYPLLFFFPLCPSGMILEVIIEIENRKNDPTGILHQAYERIGQTVEEVSPKLVKVIEQCTREGEGGQFVDYDGGRNDW